MRISSAEHAMTNGGARCGGCTLAGLILRCAPYFGDAGFEKSHQHQGRGRKNISSVVGMKISPRTTLTYKSWVLKVMVVL